MEEEKPTETETVEPTTNVTARNVRVAATQFACTADPEQNANIAERLVRQAAAEGANIILLQELFENLYFCQDQQDYFSFAKSADDSPLLARFSALARELGVILPVSFFEKAESDVYYNAVAVIDTDGTNLGVYRKSHIPDAPGSYEKYYFSPGDTGFRVFKTSLATIGVGISWDQWFPETARILALSGAELLFYPAAVGSDPSDPSTDSVIHWYRVIQGEAAANMVPIIASNRIGTEESAPGNNMHSSSITFSGSSVVMDHTGLIVKQASREEESVILADFDLNELRSTRAQWGVFRDRRPELYNIIVYSDQTSRYKAKQGRLTAKIEYQETRNTKSSDSRDIKFPPFRRKKSETAANPDASYEEQIRVQALEVAGHAPTFIGIVNPSKAYRRPRARCAICCSKTTFECKSCPDGPVPLCSTRKGRSCWQEYHSAIASGEPPGNWSSKRRKRRKSNNYNENPSDGMDVDQGDRGGGDDDQDIDDIDDDNDGNIDHHPEHADANSIQQSLPANPNQGISVENMIQHEVTVPMEHDHVEIQEHVHIDEGQKEGDNNINNPENLDNPADQQENTQEITQEGLEVQEEKEEQEVQEQHGSQDEVEAQVDEIAEEGKTKEAETSEDPKAEATK